MMPKKKGVSDIDGMHRLREKALEAHRRNRGVTETIGKVAVRSLDDLALYYTPGIAYASLAIKKNPELSYSLTNRANRIAIVSNGSRILGLGNIGPYAGYPVMEGKSLLFKKFGNVDAVPLTINADTTEEIVAFIDAIEPSFAGINIEDISSPTCFDVFDILQGKLDIPVFHDDRQGTAVVALAGLKNALRVVGKRLPEVRIAINGVGAAGTGIAQLLIAAGANDIIMCDRAGILYKGRDRNMNVTKALLTSHTNRGNLMGGIRDAAKGADILIGASEKGAFNSALIKGLADDSIVFPLANPAPEIGYREAKAAGARIVGTGASEVPNQINNLLAFPAVFRGTLDVGARKINMQMLLSASDALAKSIPDRLLSEDYVIPNFAEENMTYITANVAAAVGKAAIATGVARRKMSEVAIRKGVRGMLKRYQRIEDFMGRL
jgi:malate dehydrogenase (oxaloacetate-decarboxylating)